MKIRVYDRTLRRRTAHYYIYLNNEHVVAATMRYCGAEWIVALYVLSGRFSIVCSARRVHYDGCDPNLSGLRDDAAIIGVLVSGLPAAVYDVACVAVPDGRGGRAADSQSTLF